MAGRFAGAVLVLSALTGSTQAPLSAEDWIVARLEAMEYPALGKAARVEGTVILECELAEDGSVVRVNVVGGHLLLAKAAEANLKKWRFRSSASGGELPERLRLTYAFRLEGVCETGAGCGTKFLYDHPGQVKVIGKALPFTPQFSARASGNEDMETSGHHRDGKRGTVERATRKVETDRESARRQPAAALVRPVYCAEGIKAQSGGCQKPTGTLTAEHLSKGGARQRLILTRLGELLDVISPRCEKWLGERFRPYVEGLLGIGMEEPYIAHGVFQERPDVEAVTRRGPGETNIPAHYAATVINAEGAFFRRTRPAGEELRVAGRYRGGTPPAQAHILLRAIAEGLCRVEMDYDDDNGTRRRTDEQLQDYCGDTLWRFR